MAGEWGGWSITTEGEEKNLLNLPFNRLGEMRTNALQGPREPAEGGPQVA